jgi:hypothetical protein
LMHLGFVASESTFDYFRAARTYLETHGKPRSRSTATSTASFG